MAKPPVLTPRGEDFPRWYQDVVAKAELAENGPAAGTFVVRPWAWAIWERMQSEVDRRIKAAGAENVYFPLLIPESYLRREAEHVEGFSPELAVVTHGGGDELAEPLVIRPTSETVFGEHMARWIQSYRDLPLLLNQWCNVVRWELRPRSFLRTREFFWQEGHTAHASAADAHAYALRILHDVYEDFMVSVLAMPVLTGRKTAGERFPGAVNTLTCEAMMGDGKALQMGTSHELGQNFARAFEIDFLDDAGQPQLAWTTSWGVSTRMIGGLIMAHGDDAGLRLPPSVAPTQAVVVLVRGEEGAGERAAALTEALSGAGIRARLDDRVDQGFGRRSVDWELKGVPVRLEVGPRDLAAGTVTLVRRDSGTKQAVPLDAAVARAQAALDDAQEALWRQAHDRRQASTAEVTTVDEAAEAAGRGLARLPWSAVGSDGEARLAATGTSVRCLQRPDGSVPDTEDEAGVVATVARAY